jgi:hypothetical protein
MEKRYQVFVSSTYVDLKDERQKVLQTLMEMDCIPAGMELFPAADEEQWEFIKRIIDDCDYYLLIIGARYGSVADDGLSYTEKEFDYAVSKGIKVIALIHGEPDSLPRSKSDLSEELTEKLEKFREKVRTGRMVRFWNESSQISGEVALSLNRTIKMFPAVGWVRANSTASPELLSEINELRKKNEQLSKDLEEERNKKSSLFPVDLAGFDDEVEINGSVEVSGKLDPVKWKLSLKWGVIFLYIAPFLIDGVSELDVFEYIFKKFTDMNGYRSSGISVDQDEMHTIRIHFQALGLINCSGLYDTWYLTDLGNKLMIEGRSVKKEIL